MGRLTGGIAHDLNNLLTIIIGNLELLVEPATRVSARELMHEALQAALSGADLTRRLLAFSRRDVMLSPQSDLNAVVAGMAGMLARALGAKISLDLGLERDLWPIQLDRAELETAIINLVSNARDALPSGGHVRIVTRNGVTQAGRRVILEVADTGVGMAPAVRTRALDPYFTTKHGSAGSGLGLATVQDFVRTAGGEVNIESAPSAGTTVRLSFPPGESSIDALLTTDDAEPAQDATVLIVDDDSALRRSVRRQLGAAGFHCLEAADGERALQMLEQAGGVDLVFADLVMPGQVGGHALARAAMRVCPGIRVVLTSAQPGGKPLPGIPLLPKPYRRRELVRTLQATLALPPPPAPD